MDPRASAPRCPPVDSDEAAELCTEAVELCIEAAEALPKACASEDGSLPAGKRASSTLSDDGEDTLAGLARMSRDNCVGGAYGSDSEDAHLRHSRWTAVMEMGPGWRASDSMEGVAEVLASYEEVIEEESSAAHLSRIIAFHRHICELRSNELKLQRELRTVNDNLRRTNRDLEVARFLMARSPGESVSEIHRFSSLFKERDDDVDPEAMTALSRSIYDSLALTTALWNEQRAAVGDREVGVPEFPEDCRCCNSLEPWDEHLESLRNLVAEANLLTEQDERLLMRRSNRLSRLQTSDSQETDSRRKTSVFRQYTPDSPRGHTRVSPGVTFVMEVSDARPPTQRNLSGGKTSLRGTMALAESLPVKKSSQEQVMMVPNSTPHLMDHSSNAYQRITTTQSPTALSSRSGWRSRLDLLSVSAYSSTMTGPRRPEDAVDDVAQLLHELQGPSLGSQRFGDFAAWRAEAATQIQCAYLRRLIRKRIRTKATVRKRCREELTRRKALQESIAVAELADNAYTITQLFLFAEVNGIAVHVESPISNAESFRFGRLSLM